MSSKPVITREAKSMPGFKVSRDRLVLLLEASTAEDFKLKSMSVYCIKNLRVLKNYSKCSINGATEPK
jgi:hypothetical protein